jgi:hypothetical protein
MGRPSCIRGISCATVAFGASLLGFPVQAQPAPSFVSMGYALRAPNFNDANEVGQHAAFAMVLGALLRETLHKEPDGPCKLSSDSQLPDLSFELESKAPFGPALKECADRLNISLISGSFDQGSFGIAVSNLVQASRPISLQDGDFTSKQLSATRRRVIGQAILAKLYAGDPVVEPLLAIHDRLVSDDASYPAFTNWLTSQRNSNALGFYGRSARETEQLLALGLPMSRPSSPPELSRPHIADNNEMTLNAPNVGGESFVLVACDTALSSTCAFELDRAFCLKPVNQILRASSSKIDRPDMRLRCRIINIFGLSRWIVAETDDEGLLREFFEQLRSQTLGSSVPDPSLIEFAVFVKTK